jgi:NAD(P)-dependent dehydrogenase (short-subunit alcohol dehydrogenase family)
MGPKTDLKGKVAVITGGASGVGLALALRAAQEGMKVALADADKCQPGCRFRAYARPTH